MSCTRTTEKELRALILRLDAELNDIGGTEQDRREVLEDLAATAQDIMDEDNECDAETAPSFVIVDLDAPDGPLFWSNEDGWVDWGTESILEATAAETETLRLPMGGRVEWVSKTAAEWLSR